MKLAVSIGLFIFLTSVSPNEILCQIKSGLQPPKYDLRVNVLPDQHRLEGSGTLLLPAVNTARDHIQLALSEIMSDFTATVAEPEVSAGPVKLEERKSSGDRRGWGTTRWVIYPNHPSPAGEPVLLRITYSGEGDKTSFIFYVGPEGSFGAGIGTAWYPEVEEFPRDDDGIRLRGLRATGRLRFSVPHPYKAYASGAAQLKVSEATSPVFQFEIAEPIFFSFAVGKYTVAHRKSGPIPT